MYIKKRRLFILIPITYYIAHSNEELWFGFSAWVSQHFSPLSQTHFIFFEIVMLLLVLLICLGHLIRPNNRLLGTLLIAAQTQFACNALFHIATSLLLNGYSPGSYSSLLLAPPATYFFFNNAVRDTELKGSLRAGILTGVAIAMIAIGLLFI